MQCVNCKSQVDDDALFCPHCASKIAEATRTPQAPERSRSKEAVIFITVVATIILAIAIVAIATWFGFNSGGTPFRSNMSEAESEAQNRFQQEYTKCGDSYFKQSLLAGLIQFKNVSFSVEQVAINDADRLNGTEWKGVATVNCRLIRFYFNDTHKWSEWQSENAFINPGGNLDSYSLQKQRGKWKVANIGLSVPDNRKIDCNQIPK